MLSSGRPEVYHRRGSRSAPRHATGELEGSDRLRAESPAMTGPGPLRLEPTARRSLRDLLFERGVEFPCGGASQCGGCKVRVRAGEVPVTDEMRAALSHVEI